MPASVAYLILAHDAPAHLGRLARRLASPHARLFVHVDAKAEVAPFDSALAGVPGAERLGARVRCEWGGFSLVRATLALLAAARASGPFARYALLSGADYVLRPAAEIEATLLGSTDEFVALERRLTDPAHARRFGWVRRFHVHDTPLYPALVKAGYLLPRRRYPAGLVPWQGSQWWALTAGAAHHVLDFLDARPDVLGFHRWTHAPDEVLIQSVLAASPYADRTLSLAPGPPVVFGAHYVDWRVPGRSPRVLTLDDLPALRASAALFGRKVRPGASAALLDALDAGA